MFWDKVCKFPGNRSVARRQARCMVEREKTTTATSQQRIHFTNTHRFSLLRRLSVLSPLTLFDMGHSDASHGTLPPPRFSRPGLVRPPPPPSLLSNSSSP